MSHGIIDCKKPQTELRGAHCDDLGYHGVECVHASYKWLVDELLLHFPKEDLRFNKDAFGAYRAYGFSESVKTITPDTLKSFIKTAKDMLPWRSEERGCG